MRSTDEYGEISWFLNHVLRTIDPVIVDPHDLFFARSHWSILVFWLLHILGVSIERRWSFHMCPGYPRAPGCSVSRVSLLHAPSRKSRASCACSRSLVSPLREDWADPGCSWVSLLHKPTQDHRASAYKHLAAAPRPQ